MNVFTFSGNVTKDCEVRYTSAGKAVATFTVAVNSGWGDNQKTTYPRCVLFGKRADGKLPKSLTKGKPVIVSGEVSLNTREYQGKNYADLDVVVDKLDFQRGENLGGMLEEILDPKSQQQPAPQAPTGGGSVLDDDIPFAPVDWRL